MYYNPTTKETKDYAALRKFLNASFPRNIEQVGDWYLLHTQIVEDIPVGASVVPGPIELLDGHYTQTCSIEESPAPDIDSVRGQMLMNLDYQQSHIAQAITESEASEDFSSAKAYQTIYKHNASLYDVIAGARSVVELNSITILAPTPETVWEMASALPIEETL